MLSLLPVFLFQHLVGRLIGKQGRYVSFLKQNSGAKIYISTLPYTQEFQICHIEGESPDVLWRGSYIRVVLTHTISCDWCFSPGTQQQVDKALSLIGKKFKDLDLTNLYAPPPPPLTLPSLPMTSWVRKGSLGARHHLLNWFFSCNIFRDWPIYNYICQHLYTTLSQTLHSGEWRQSCC